MISAEVAKERVESVSFLSDSDFQFVNSRIEQAIEGGRRRTSIRYDRNDKRFWPMKSYLDSLGYQTTARETPYGNSLIWSW